MGATGTMLAKCRRMAQLAQCDVRVSGGGFRLLLAIILASTACDSEPSRDQASVPSTAGAGSNPESSEGSNSTQDQASVPPTAGAGSNVESSEGSNSTGDAPAGAAEEIHTPDAHCKRTDLTWVPPASEVGRISCSAGITITTTHHGGRGWALVSPAPPDFAALHAFGDAPAVEFDLPEEVSGGLLASPGEFPAVVHSEATTDGQVFELYRGLPASLTAERLVSETSVTMRLHEDQVFWVTATSNDDGVDLAVSQASSLETPATTVHYPCSTQSWLVVSGRSGPRMMFADDEQWFAADAMEQVAVGVARESGGEQWDLDGDRAISVFGQAQGQGSGRPRALVVTGAASDFMASRFAQLYGMTAEEATALAERDPASHDYVPAPLLVLPDAPWTPPMSQIMNGGNSNPGSCGSASGSTSTTPVITAMSQVTDRISRDSAGVPWLVAVVTTGTAVTRVEAQWCGEFCCLYRTVSVQNVMRQLKLIRLQLPSTERTYEIDTAPTVTSDSRIGLQMAGPHGTLVFIGNGVSSSAVSLWQIDLDAV